MKSKHVDQIETIVEALRKIKLTDEANTLATIAEDEAAALEKRGAAFKHSEEGAEASEEVADLEHAAEQLAETIEAFTELTAELRRIADNG